MDFYSQIMKIKERPGMWIGDLSLNNMKRFLDGVTFCMENNNIDDYFVTVFEKYFNWYVNYELLKMPISDEQRANLAVNNSRSFCQLIPIVQTDTKNQIDMFFEVFESFYQDYINEYDFISIIDYFKKDYF